MLAYACQLPLPLQNSSMFIDLSDQNPCHTKVLLGQIFFSSACGISYIVIEDRKVLRSKKGKPNQIPLGNLTVCY
jgi:hypothetical protein